MKLSIVTSSITRNSGGVGQVVKSLAQSLQQWIEVVLYCRLETNTFKELPLNRKYKVIAEESSLFGLPGGSRKLNISIAKSLHDLDVIHCNCLWESCLWSAAATARGHQKPYLVTPHGMLDSWAINNSKWKKRIIGWLFTNKYLRNAACIHALCQSEYESVRAYGLKNPVAVIPNGIDLPEIKPDLKPLWRDVIDEDKKVMLFLGRIHPKKGLVNLVNAWAKVRSSGWALAVAGWDQCGHEDELKRLVTQAGLEKNIVFLGPIFDEKKQACLQHADAFILPSFSEGLPMSVLEAWAYGLPVIMTPQCNIPEGFAANAAIKLQPEVASIASGLSCFFALSEDKQKQIGQNGLRLVQEKFTWPRIAAQMIEVYKWVLGQGDKPECVRLD